MELSIHYEILHPLQLVLRKNLLIEI